MWTATVYSCPGEQPGHWGEQVRERERERERKGREREEHTYRRRQTDTGTGIQTHRHRHRHSGTVTHTHTHRHTHTKTHHERGDNRAALPNVDGKVARGWRIKVVHILENHQVDVVAGRHGQRGLALGRASARGIPARSPFRTVHGGIFHRQTHDTSWHARAPGVYMPAFAPHQSPPSRQYTAAAQHTPCRLATHQALHHAAEDSRGTGALMRAQPQRAAQGHWQSACWRETLRDNGAKTTTNYVMLPRRSSDR
jgi:hypothetical protein